VDGTLWQRDDANSLLQEKLTRVRSGEFVGVPLEYILNDIDSGFRNLSVQADYFRPLGGGRLEFGLVRGSARTASRTSSSTRAIVCRPQLPMCTRGTTARRPSALVRSSGT
jgi:hypothetical protein